MKATEIDTLIAQFQAGNNDGLALLVRECKDPCIRHLLTKTNCSKEDAEELFTEAIVNFRERAINDKLGTISNLKGYLAGTCYNMWLNLYKKRKQHPHVTENVDHYFHEYMDGAIDEDTDLLAMKERLLDISTTALESLGKKCKKIITYFYIEGRNMEEIAVLMDFANEGVARSTKYRCFKTLKEKVKLLEKDIYDN